MRNLHWLCAFLLLLGAPVLARAEVNFPKTDSYVDDFANVLSPEDEQRLGDLARDLDRKTGYQLLAVTLPSLEGEDVQHAATRYIIEKGAGRKGDDTGLAILYAVAEKKAFIATGRGTEALITDAYAGEVFRNTFRAYFRQGNVGEAFYQSAVRLSDRIQREAGDTAKGREIPEGPGGGPTGPGGYPPNGYPGFPGPSGGGGISPFFLLFIGFFIIVAIAGASGRKNRCPRCKSYLSVTDDIIKRPTIFWHGYGVRRRRCPNCGYSDERRYTIPRTSTPFIGTGIGTASQRRDRRDDDSWFGGIGGFGGGSGGFGGGGGGWGGGGGGGGWSGGGGFSGGGGDAGGGGAGGDL